MYIFRQNYAAPLILPLHALPHDQNAAPFAHAAAEEPPIELGLYRRASVDPRCMMRMPLPKAARRAGVAGG